MHKVKVIKSQLYPVNLIFVIGNDYDKIKKMTGVDPYKAMGQVIWRFEFRGLNGVMINISEDSLNGCPFELVSTISHEAYHATAAIFEGIGETHLDIEQQEPAAYQLGFISGELFKFCQKVKEGINPEKKSKAHEKKAKAKNTKRNEG